MSRTDARTDEEFAREAFHRFLESRGSMEIQWERGSDPPDFVLAIGTESYPVEVTQIMSSLRTGRHHFSERGWVASLKSLENRIEAEMIRRGVLHGSYALDLEPVPDLRELESKLIPAVQEYLIATADRETASRKEIFRHRGGIRIHIEKVGNASDLIGSVMSIGGAKWQVEVVAELAKLISAAADTKRKKSLNLPNLVLLLIDVYHYGETEDWIEAAKEIDLTPFHTVARVFGERDCQILHSRIADWKE